MTLAELKCSLHKLVVDTDDIDILNKVLCLFTDLISQKTDWADSLTEQEKKLIETGLKEADEGKLTSYKEVRNNIDININDKRK